ALPLMPHGAGEKAKIAHRYVGERMRPVFEHAFVDILRLVQMGATVIWNAAEQEVVMAALDHVDDVDLHIAEMLYGRLSCRRATAEGRRRVEPLCPQPYPASPGEVDRQRRAGTARHELPQGIGWLSIPILFFKINNSVL